MGNFQKDFDALFDAMLADWKNQYPEADLSKGSLIYLKSACLASALWGLYKYQDWIAKQIFPDTADAANLEHHAWIYGLTRVSGESDAELLERVLDDIRHPAAGGNQYDYVKWAKSIDNVAKAFCIPLGQGLGTVDVMILADKDVTGSEIPSSHTMSGTSTSLEDNALIDSAATFNGALPVRIGDVVVNDALETETTVTAIVSGTRLTLAEDIFTAIGQNYSIKSLVAQVYEYIDDVRPVTASIMRVMAPSVSSQAVTVAVTGSGVDKSTLAAQISSYMSNMEPGSILYKSRIIAIAIDAGAVNAVVSNPASDVDPGIYAVIRPGTITVN